MSDGTIGIAAAGRADGSTPSDERDRLRSGHLVCGDRLSSAILRLIHTNAGQAKAAIVQAASTADTGRSKNGRGSSRPT
ncbi:MAG: hypothetical protein QOJ86_1357 [Bradyrhizobium sp.]|nr:hypothetical protein [Bradyrhizobium sp.]